MKSLKENTPALAVSRVVLAFSWIYQGAVPKIACQSPGEIELLSHVVGVYELACSLLTWMGYGEILFGIVLLFTFRSWVFLLNIIALLILLIYVAVFQPDLFTLPFNPLTLNVSLIGVSLIAYTELAKHHRFGKR